MKTVRVGAKVYRVLADRKNSVTVQPLDTEYPHVVIFRMPGETRWGTSFHLHTARPVRHNGMTYFGRAEDGSFSLSNPALAQ